MKKLQQQEDLRVLKNISMMMKILFTYGDGLADINIKNKIDFHLNHKKNLTVTAVQLPGRYGSLEIKNNEVKNFLEKPKGDNLTINGGFLF